MASTIHAIRAKRGAAFGKSVVMWVVLLEIVLALGLAVLIVWWTWPRKPPGKDQ